MSRQYIDPVLRYWPLKKNKESVTVSIAIIYGGRNFARMFSMRERLLPENFLKILLLVRELKMKIGQISVPYES